MFAQVPRRTSCELRQKFSYRRVGVKRRKRYVAPEVTVTVVGMDQTMSQTTRKELLEKLRRHYSSAGPEHKRKLLDQAQELLGYHRKAAIRALRAPTVVRDPRLLTGRPVTYEPELLLPYLRPIWRATDYACGRRLVAMWPEWIPAYEQHERKVPGEVRDKLLEASGRTLDRWLEPLRGCGDRTLLDASRHAAAAADPHSRQPLGGGRGGVAGS